MEGLHPDAVKQSLCQMNGLQLRTAGIFFGSWHESMGAIMPLNVQIHRRDAGKTLYYLLTTDFHGITRNNQKTLLNNFIRQLFM